MWSCCPWCADAGAGRTVAVGPVPVLIECALLLAAGATPTDEASAEPAKCSEVRSRPAEKVELGISQDRGEVNRSLTCGGVAAPTVEEIHALLGTWVALASPPRCAGDLAESEARPPLVGAPSDGWCAAACGPIATGVRGATRDDACSMSMSVPCVSECPCACGGASKCAVGVAVVDDGAVVRPLSDEVPEGSRATCKDGTTVAGGVSTMADTMRVSVRRGGGVCDPRTVVRGVGGGGAVRPTVRTQRATPGARAATRHTRATRRVRCTSRGV